jgi:hypothetical protein
MSVDGANSGPVGFGQFQKVCAVLPPVVRVGFHRDMPINYPGLTIGTWS